MPRTPLLLLIVLSTIACGCSPPKSAALGEFEHAIANDGSITFRSWNGKWIGMDGDTDIRFLADGKTEMTEYGFGVQRYRGSYNTNDAGEITASFDGFGRAWPKMVIERDAKSLILRPVDRDTGFVMGNRGGATTSGKDGTYWPFRPVNPETEPTSQPTQTPAGSTTRPLSRADNAR